MRKKLLYLALSSLCVIIPLSYGPLPRSQALGFYDIYTTTVVADVLTVRRAA
jgi:hypothetical protein